MDSNLLFHGLRRDEPAEFKRITRYAVFSQAIMGRPGQRAFAVGLDDKR